MQHKFPVRPLSITLMLMTSAAYAQSNQLTREDLICPCLHPVNRFGIAYRAGFSVSARFKNLGSYAPNTNPGPATGGNEERFYDDGYNRNDSSTNNNNSTWFWGYQNASQISGNNITMTSSSAVGTGTSGERKEDPQHGVELTYNRELGHFEKWRWGIEAALGYTDVTIGNNSPVFSTKKDIADTLANLGSTFPGAPYSGTYNGPGDLISTVPSRQIFFTANGARATGIRQFDADIYGLRLGPYLELPLDDRWAVSFSGGMALLSVNSDFKFRETVTLAGLPPKTTQGDGSHSDIVPGGYIGGNFLYALRENVNLFAGAQFQAAGTYSHKESGKEVELDLGKSVFVNLGVGFSF